jgi:hypothetical protein
VSAVKASRGSFHVRNRYPLIWNRSLTYIVALSAAGIIAEGYSLVRSGNDTLIDGFNSDPYGHGYLKPEELKWKALYIVTSR